MEINYYYVCDYCKIVIKFHKLFQIYCVYLYFNILWLFRKGQNRNRTQNMYDKYKNSRAIIDRGSNRQRYRELVNKPCLKTKVFYEY